MNTSVSLFYEQIRELNEKLKDMDLEILQHKRKADDSESKLKELRQLFESVSSERNLYSKALLEANVSDTFLLLKYLTSQYKSS